MTNSGAAKEVERRKICWLFPHFHPVLAGAAERFRRYAPQLRDDGFDLEVITARDPETLAPEELVDGFLPVHRMPVTAQVTQRDLVLYQAAAERLQRSPSSGVVQTIKAERYLLGPLLKMRRSGRRLVQVCTMVEPGMEALSPARRLKMRIAGWLTFLPYSNIITSSTVMSDWHRHFGVPQRKLHVIPNGVNTQRFRPAHDAAEKKAIRADLGLPADAVICLFAGNIIPRKRPHLLVAAWAQVKQRHPQAVLILVGSAARPTIGSSREGAEIAAYQEALFKAIDESGPSVRWLGERKDMERFYQAADIFAFPTEQEGFGNVLLEAMAAELPVLSARFRGYPEQELEGKVRLVGETAEQWAVALMELIADSAARKGMAVDGKDLINRRFRVEKVVEQIETVYLQSSHR